jgi:hypothetical protein
MDVTTITDGGQFDADLTGVFGVAIEQHEKLKTNIERGLANSRYFRKLKEGRLLTNVHR